MRKAALILSLAGILSMQASELEVKSFMYVGPIPLTSAVTMGEVNDTYARKKVVDSNFAPDFADAPRISIEGVAPTDTTIRALHALAFDVENRGFAKTKISVAAPDGYKLTCDGRKAKDEVSLRPGTHRFVLKYVTEPGATDSLGITLTPPENVELTLVEDGSHIFTWEDVQVGRRLSKAVISPLGNYVLADYYDYDKDGERTYVQSILRVSDGKDLGTTSSYARWLPGEDNYYIVRNTSDNGKALVRVNPLTRQEEIFAPNIPAGHFTMSPTKEFLIYSLEQEGEEEDPDIYQVLNPEDRQPGWRDRSYPAIWRFGGSPLLEPLTQGNANVNLCDISNDGKKLLLMANRLDMTSRPTTKLTLLQLDLETMKADTLVLDDGFISDASFSPDGTKVAVIGGAEAFNRIGCVLPDSVIPSTYDYQLFVLDIPTGDVKPLTRDFDPTIEEIIWSAYDNKIYATVSERDLVQLYAFDPARETVTRVNIPEDVVRGVRVADSSPMITVWGQSPANPDRAYTYNTRNGRSNLICYPAEKHMENVRLAQFNEWNFVNQRGDTISGSYYLPDNFDPTRKYPLIVYYYGGCSPTTRYFASGYPFHAYSQQDYVVYVVQPSGATGFGQEFASRHVSTGGQGVAEDIIEGVNKFCEEHPYIDRDKMACLGASYGGFMTMYLLTQTDMFATAVSHAGISDHTSYWGEGYWGYSYSETSMGNDLPWTNPELYVRQSPLYNAYKIHTPILFLHGDRDTNVPPGESIQMFTALKRLGAETALVEVTGQNHHVTDPKKNRKWLNTIYAWLAKYLKGDDAWWNEMYPDRGL